MQAKNRIGRLKNVVILVIFITNIMAVILLFSSFLAWNVSTLKTNLFSYIGLGFGLILLLNIGYLAFWLMISNWKYAAICLVAILLCYRPITTFFPLHLNSPQAPDSAIHILSYNVQGFPDDRNKDSKEQPILDYIVETDADIVCLQEYLVSKTGQSIFSQQDVNRKLNMYPYRSITGLESSGKYHILGLACFSKYPIENTHEVVFESSYNGATVYTINIDGNKYTVANVHLESNSIKEEDIKLYSDFLQNTDSVKLETVTTNIRSRLGSAYRMRAKQVEIGRASCRERV